MFVRVCALILLVQHNRTHLFLLCCLDIVSNLKSTNSVYYYVNTYHIRLSELKRTLCNIITMAGYGIMGAFSHHLIFVKNNWKL